MTQASAIRTMLTAALLCGAVAAGGCGILKAPTLPAPVQTPRAVVDAVRLVEASNEASKYQIIVTLSNPNPFPLPMTGSAYRIRVNGADYKSNIPPNATIPADGAISVSLPAVLSVSQGDWRSVPTPASGGGGSGGGGGGYAVSGSIELLPPGTIRQVLYEAGMPPPRTPFRGQGSVQVVSGSLNDETDTQPSRGQDQSYQEKAGNQRPISLLPSDL